MANCDCRIYETCAFCTEDKEKRKYKPSVQETAWDEGFTAAMFKVNECHDVLCTLQALQKNTR